MNTKPKLMIKVLVPLVVITRIAFPSFSPMFLFLISCYVVLNKHSILPLAFFTQNAKAKPNLA